VFRASSERLLVGRTEIEEMALVEADGPSDCDVLAEFYDRGVGKWAAVPL
jgi:hypothetical protein